MRILMSGASGLIGSALAPFLTSEGHRVCRLVRSRPQSPDEVYWQPMTETIDESPIEALDAVVHLAGENIASGRWTTAKKASIRDSRVKGTQFLCKCLARLGNPPKVLISASASGYYGDRGAEVLTETSAGGSGFLAEVCREWEAATERACAAGIRVVNLRTGVVLSPRGGALAKMLPPFKMGVGGRIGNGKQYMSWIVMDDLIRLILHILNRDALVGPVNAVAPNPVTNAEFTKTLGRVLGRPTPFPVPAFAARLAFGEMANDALLASTRLKPAKLIETGYAFRFPELEAALRHVLGKE